MSIWLQVRRRRKLKWRRVRKSQNWCVPLQLLKVVIYFRLFRGCQSITIATEMIPLLADKSTYAPLAFILSWIKKHV